MLELEAWQPQLAGHSQRLYSLCQSWGGSFWSYEELISSLDRDENRLYLGKVNDDDVGLIFYTQIFDESELLFVYIRPEWRGNSYARQLMLAYLGDVQAAGVTRCFLEVRASNQSAQSLYKSLAYECISCRKSYYSDGEDALIYQKEFR